MSDEITSFSEIMGILRADNPWMAAEDLDGEEEVTIEKFKPYPAANVGGETKSIVALHFTDHPKRLIINKGHVKSLRSLFRTKNAEELKGKVITLYAGKLDKPYNGNSHGVRIKDEA